MPSQPRKPTGSWEHPKQHSQQGEEGICPSALCCETSPGALRPDGECSAQERHGAAGAHPEEGHQNDLRDGTPPCEDRLRAGLCSTEKGRLWGELRAACPYLEGL